MNAPTQLPQIDEKIWDPKENVVIPQTQILTTPSIWVSSLQLGLTNEFVSPPASNVRETASVLARKVRRINRIYLEPQDEGGFVARSTEYKEATGQGETEVEAIKDLNDAIQTLKDFYAGKLTEEY
jgi:predicted RNase H-like HicB family nuclease